MVVVSVTSDTVPELGGAMPPMVRPAVVEINALVARTVHVTDVATCTPLTHPNMVPPLSEMRTAHVVTDAFNGITSWHPRPTETSRPDASYKIST
jgi:hypothetical protein